MISQLILSRMEYDEALRIVESIMHMRSSPQFDYLNHADFDSNLLTGAMFLMGLYETYDFVLMGTLLET